MIEIRKTLLTAHVLEVVVVEAETVFVFLRGKTVAHMLTSCDFLVKLLAHSNLLFKF